jgi:hypothetical protein
LISDYFQLIEKKTSEMSIIADKSIEFREFDIDEGLLKGEIVFIDGSALEFLEYLNGNRKPKYRFHYMDDKGALVFRYDNAPHHQVSTFPHHKHLPTNIIASHPPGLIDVIDEIEKMVSQSHSQ